MSLPNCETLQLDLAEGVLTITLNRPDCRNAMNITLVNELIEAFDAVAEDRSVRAIVVRGADGNFCAGADIKDMAGARAKPITAEGTVDGDPIAKFNRRFGDLMEKANHAPQAVIAYIEGAVLGGGFGLSCVSDVAICHAEAQFGLPETGLGITPAQIAPFVVQRIGITQARRLGVTGGRFDGRYAHQLGLVHEVCDSAEEMDALLAKTLKQVRRCAPGANAGTKAVMLRVGTAPMNELLDRAAIEFAAAARGEEGVEGMTAFIEKRQASWNS